jgi:hypothetical protein
MERNYAFVGDVHSQIRPFEKAIGHCRSNNLTPILLGDLFDSRMASSDSSEVYWLAKKAQKELGAIILRSNHQNKFERFARGNKVKVEGEFSRTLEDFSSAGISVQEVATWLNTFPYGVVFKDSKGKEYRCAHAMFPSWIAVPHYSGVHLITEVTSKARDYMIYGPRVPGASWPDEETRVLWWEKETSREWVRVAGHYHTVVISDKNLVLDGQMGGSLKPGFDLSTARLCLWDVESRQLHSFT